MPPISRPNPSFVVLSLKDRSKLKAVNKALAKAMDGAAGNLLTPIGEHRFVLSRVALKTLGAGRTEAEIMKTISSLPNVTSAARVSGGDLVNNFCNSWTGWQPEPADPRGQWYLEKLRVPQAWAKFGAGVDLDVPPWRSVRVGHIDTGYTEHPVFGPWVNHRSPSVRAEDGIDYYDRNPSPLDHLDYRGRPGHGTRTMSVLAGRLAAGGGATEFNGVAPRVSVVPYRITNCVVVDTLDNTTKLDEAIGHATVDAGCSVMSISLGDPCDPRRTVGTAVDRAYEAGVIIVAAAGNITKEVVYPGRFSRVVTAGGVTIDDEPWDNGARGTRVDICAYADRIQRANAHLEQGKPAHTIGGGGDGTSFATGMIAGAAALWLAYRKNDIGAKAYRGWQIVEAFRHCAKASARRPGADWDDTRFGAGILDVAGLLDCALPDPGTLEKRQSTEEDRRVVWAPSEPVDVR